jgi:acetoacetyl-CoA synthetase
VHGLHYLVAAGARRAPLRGYPFDQPFVARLRGEGTIERAGPTLLAHGLEHRLRLGLRRGDRLFVPATVASPAWTWQLCALASGAAIVLADTAVDRHATRWNAVEREQVTVLATGPSCFRRFERNRRPARRGREVIDVTRSQQP